MKDTAPQLALREWRQDMQRPETLAVLGGIGVVLAVLGPFDTDQVMSFVPRLVYWLVIVVLTYSAGHLASGLLHRSPAQRLPRLPLILLTALVIGLAVSVVVLLINLAAFNNLPSGAELWSFLATTFAIALVISVVFDIVERARRSTAPAAIPLLDRLPFDKRGPLVALTVQDHYVLIQTTKGCEMILMRLSDAIRETGDTPGLQVHRSHWVALRAVTAASRTGDRALLTMSHGPDIPVSRANLPKLKEAGLLPR